MTELRQDLGHLVNRAAYGGDRIVLVAHGQPTSLSSVLMILSV
jgi:prevent-host-death family protein